MELGTDEKICDQLKESVWIMLKKFETALTPDKKGRFRFSDQKILKLQNRTLYLIQMHYAQTKRCNENRKKAGIEERVNHLPPGISDAIMKIPMLVKI